MRYFLNDITSVFFFLVSRFIEIVSQIIELANIYDLKCPNPNPNPSFRFIDLFNSHAW